MTDSPSGPIQERLAGAIVGVAALGMFRTLLECGVRPENPDEIWEGFIRVRSRSTGKVVRMVRVG